MQEILFAPMQDHLAGLAGLHEIESRLEFIGIEVMCDYWIDVESAL